VYQNIVETNVANKCNVELVERQNNSD